MIGSILGHHAPLTRDYPNAPPTPPAPPAPPTPPQPPQAEPIAFGAVTRASLFGVIGNAISSTTLATITCSDASMTIAQSETVAGLTFSYAAGVLTVAGTPTGSTRVQRVVVSYIASDGSNTVRGSTSHEITLTKVTEVLTIGSIAGITGRAGSPLNVTICTPTSNFDADVKCYGATAIQGVTVNWTWDRALRSGTLSAVGTPEQAFGPNGGFTFGFIANQQGLGSGVSSCTIVERYEAPAPAPAPAPSPPAPSPSPPPVPAPAPAPGSGPDSTLADVRLLMRFDAGTATPAATQENKFVVASYGAAPGNTITLNETLLPGQSIEVVEVILFSQNESGADSYSGSDVTVSGTTVTIPQTIPVGNGYSVSYRIVSDYVGVWAAAIGPSLNGNGPTLTTGAVGEAALFSTATATISGAVASLDGISAGLSVECMADISATAWSALTAAGGDQRFCPVVSYTANDGALLWALGFLSIQYNAGAQSLTPYRLVYARMWTALDNSLSPISSGFIGLGAILSRPARFIHLAGTLKRYTPTSWERAAWLSGSFSESRTQVTQIAPVARGSGALQIGGTCAAFGTYDGSSPRVTIVPFIGAVDELRIKTPGQYADLMNGGQPAAITLARRVIPWPNY